jgi:glycosyltransferase involved in cell wall biosynthesis
MHDHASVGSQTGQRKHRGCERRRPVKVVLVHEHYCQAGGEDVVFELEGDLLRSRGHDVVPYAVHNDEVSKLGRIALARTTIWNQGAYRAFSAVLRSETPDVVHVHNTLPLLSPSIYHAAHAVGVPVVQTLHNYRPICANGLFLRNGAVCEDCLGAPFPWRGALRGCYRESRAASAVVSAMVAVHGVMGTWRRHVDAYIAPSAFTRQKFIESGLDGERIWVKPNFVSPDLGAGDGSGGYALFVGRLAAEKGVHLLLDAWKRVDRPAPLIIAGDGPLASDVASAAAQMPHVTWLGRLTPQRVYDLLGRAACAVVPSTCYETFGRVVAEAFSKGTPVIASDGGAMAELVTDEVTGFLFRAGDPDDLAARVKRLFDGGTDHSALRASARHAFESRFTAEKNYDMLLDIYRSVRPRAHARLALSVS